MREFQIVNTGINRYESSMANDKQNFMPQNKNR